jgi:hypothetical protein
MESVAKKIRLTPQVDLAIDDLIAGISELETPDLEQFLQKIGRLVARRKSPSATERESILLQAINQSSNALLQNRYAFLSKKQNAGKVSEAEHEELLTVIDKLEILQAQRLENLIELAHLRNVSLDTLMNNLNLNFAYHD